MEWSDRARALADATVVYVAFGVRELDLRWVPARGRVVVVHNDLQLIEERCEGATRVRHLYPGTNIGFGAGVNLALEVVVTGRTILCNPDTALRPEHWRVLVDAGPHEVVTLPLLDNESRWTSVVNRYPTPLSLALTAWDAGRLAPRGGGLRRVLAPMLGPWGAQHLRSLTGSTGVWPLTSHWPSGAVLSVATDRVRSVGGFDPTYFLYLEDVDLARRLGARFPEMVIRVPRTAAARHAVGGSVHDSRSARRVRYERRRSALRYACACKGARWRASSVVVSAAVAASRRHLDPSAA